MERYSSKRGIIKNHLLDMRTNDTTLNCFLVDDDLDDQEIFCMALCGVDDSIKCIFANDGVHALERLNDCTITPDFIFIDLNMPRMNGLQCLVEIKKLNHLKHIPVYMYSTAADPKAIVEAKQFGAIDFIVKPTNISELSTILATLFINRQVLD